VGDDNVVEGLIGAPKARESDLDHHFERGSGMIRKVVGRGCRPSGAGVTRCRFNVHRPIRWKFWTPAAWLSGLMRCANQTQPHPFPEQAHWKLLKAAGDVSSPSPSFEVETAIFG
jgi:hypothetical protein